MPKLGPSLQQALAVWRTELGYAAQRDQSARAEVEGRQVTVIVTYQGEVAPLRDAGLRTGFDSGGEVSGRIRLARRRARWPPCRASSRSPWSRASGSCSTAPSRRCGCRGRSRRPTPWPGRGANVIVAVIDTGIDIFHDSFRKSDGTTRILELWDQSATAVGGGIRRRRLPSRVGRVYRRRRDQRRARRRAAVRQHRHTSATAPTSPGSPPATAARTTAAAFPGRYVGVAPEADLVIVKAIGAADGSPARSATRCNGAPAGASDHGTPGNEPVVINCSFGSDTGPHDGTAFIDGFVDQILRPAGGPLPPGLAIVVAAGNAGDDEIHESGSDRGQRLGHRRLLPCRSGFAARRHPGHLVQRHGDAQRRR